MISCAESGRLGENAASKYNGRPIAARAVTASCIFGDNMTTVRDLKDEIDKRAYHGMLKQLGLSEADFAIGRGPEIVR